MSAPMRFAVVLIGVACILTAIYNAVTPDRNTVGLFGVQSDGSHARLTVSVPSPGTMRVRTGDELDVPATTARDRLAYFGAATTGSTIHVPLIHDGRRVDVAVVVPPGVTTPPRSIDLVLVILEVAFGILVMVRAGTVPLARMVVLLAVIEELGTVCADFLYTAPSPTLGFAVGLGAEPFYEGGTSFVALWAASMLPGGVRNRTPLFAAALVAVSLISELNSSNLIAVPLPLLPAAWLNGLSVLSVLVNLSLAVALVALAQAAPTDQRMRSMWFLSTLIGWFVGQAIGVLQESYFISASWLFWISYLLLSFTLLGPIYATLRHRILDLNFVITRSAVYAVLSIVMLGSFAAAEWIAAKLTEAVLAGNFWKGIAAQLLSFSVAIVIGLYLRSVHSHLEVWVNGVLFRERIRKLHMLESFAREADLVQTRSELLRATHGALTDSIDAEDVAVYVTDAGALVRAHGTGTEPRRLERSDRLVLQLLERQRPFVSEVQSLKDWLIVPLALRREIIGAIACGPKRDHTTYLPDELRALIDVAQHVATSYALLLPALGAASPAIVPES